MSPAAVVESAMKVTPLAAEAGSKANVCTNDLAFRKPQLIAHDRLVPPLPELISIT